MQFCLISLYNDEIIQIYQRFRIERMAIILHALQTESIAPNIKNALQ